MKRVIEVGIAWSNGTWDTKTVGIPMQGKKPVRDYVSRVLDDLEGVAGFWIHYEHPDPEWRQDKIELEYWRD